MSRAFERLPPGKLTYEDYVRLPDDGRRYEILDGELEVSPAPAPRHQRVLLNLLRIVDRHVEERDLGLVYVAAGREAIVTERAIEGPPDLAVEILSPWSDRRDRVAKAGLYARYGIRHYWIPDPVARTLEVYEVKGAEYRRVAVHEGAACVRTT